VQTVKSVTAREVFAWVPEVKKKLWGGEFLGKGYFVNTVGQHGNGRVIAESVKRQGEGRKYQQLYKGQIEFGF
jgi:putative transposase